MNSRAYSVLDIKSINDGERVLRGTATTPTPDRLGDIVEPLGVSFKNPLPLLWAHKSDKPVGLVRFSKPTKDGIEFEATLPTIEEPGALQDRVTEAWQSVKAGLVRAVSIGFRALEHAFMDDGGIRFIKTEVMELSLVVVPANADCQISTIRSIDTELRAASGQSQEVSPANPAGDSAPRKPTTKVAKSMAKKTIAEQISAFENTRAAKSARLTELMDNASESGETLDQAQSEEYDDLQGEVKALDAHLVRLREHEKANKAAAVAVEATDEASGSAARTGRVPATVRSLTKLPPGIPFTRYVLAQARARGNLVQALEIAKSNEQWKSESPEVEMVLRSAVNAGTTTDTTWASPLVVYQNMSSDFISYLDPLTIIGRIPGFRRVPFKVKIPRETGTATVNWVGEGKIKPLSSLAFDTVTMEFAKIAGIIPLTEELVRFSTPSAEAIVRDRLAAAITAFMDNEFVDPTNASTDVSPASVTYGVTPVGSTGTTAAALRADVKTLMATFLSNNLSPAGSVWIMTQQQALAISLMVNTLGQPEFVGIDMNGGTFLGLPVVASENIPSSGGSPTDGGLIILAKASEILLADDGQVTIDASREASLQMDSTPDSPETASTTMVSMWQHNMVAIKAERYIRWEKARSTAVGFISAAKYAE
jgi:HK97 family phage major capsid protein/HK97 family phage prohead protease